jgi:acetyl-CoA carboxylase biotin carboxylase subunit
MFKKILIANRGEIAVRVMRACREMGIATVAVYSEADRRALHVLKADEAYAIGPAPAKESYLRIDKILDVAQRCRAEAIHPGYGFLSENDDFARACEQAGITLIGPSASSMEMMGSKTRAREVAVAAGVPVVPGTTEPVKSGEEARRIAAQFGYPVMLKAAAGGGGKGMRQVRSEAEIEAALRDAQSEAQNAFGDSEVYIEKFIERPRHIEVQVLGDRHGTLLHLGERECSVQRRHQKVVEEAPSPFVDAAMRERMGEAAVRAARAAGYYNAGTVEFLVDQQRNFYFLEMNTRLQVEHPVTELVTGLDLVKLQIRVAAGEKLSDIFPGGQADIRLRGAAIECRIYAEDPDNMFFPCPGLIRHIETPSGPGVRDDSGVYSGWTVPMDYDPLLSKLVAWAGTREEAIQRMRRALSEYHVSGIKTNLRFFESILNFPDFARGDLDTGLIERLLRDKAGDSARAPRPVSARTRAAAIAAALFHEQLGGAPVAAAGAATTEESRWQQAGRSSALRGNAPGGPTWR